MAKLLKQKNFIRNALITIYVLVVLGISATARAEVSIYPIFTNHEQVKTETYVGEIAMTVEGNFYLIVSNDEYYELKTNVDLAEYNGLMVQVEGFELKHKVGPVVQTASLDPLQEGSELSGAPVLVVFGISEVAK